MSSKKPLKQNKKDKAWQDKIESRAKAEKVKLDHPQGKERFNKVLRHTHKKK